jgi:hypothetical protein
MSAQEVCLSQQGRIQSLQAPVAKLVQMLSGPLQPRYGGKGVTLFQIGIA